MPTGYTAKIADGITFREFALDCARAFGACITLRDEPGGGEAIPDEFKPDTGYHDNALEEARTKLFDLQRMTDAEKRSACEQANTESVAYWNQQAEKTKALRAKYDEMMKQVDDWTPPTDGHEGLKAFMKEQIQSSIDFDCHVYDAPPLVSVEDWYANALKTAQRDIDYHQKRKAEEDERAKSRTQWVQALKRSL